VEQALDRQQARIDGILREYGVPLVPVAATLPTVDGRAADRKE